MRNILSVTVILFLSVPVFSQQLDYYQLQKIRRTGLPEKNIPQQSLTGMQCSADSGTQPGILLKDTSAMMPGSSTTVASPGNKKPLGFITNGGLFKKMFHPRTTMLIPLTSLRLILLLLVTLPG